MEPAAVETGGLSFYMESVTIQKLRPEAILPVYASEGDSGMDVCAPEDVEIRPGHNQLVKLGWKIGIPKHPLHDYGYRWELQVRPRSGVALKTDLAIANAPGTIDNFYRDEVGVIVRNNFIREHDIAEYSDYSLTLKGGSQIFRGNGYHNPVGTYLIRKGERFAQLVFAEVIRPLQIVEGIVPLDDSRGGGFGHSGL